MTATYVTSDLNLLSRRPIDRRVWEHAWRLATDHPRCTEPPHDCPHGQLEPELRWPGAQVGTCHARGDRRHPDRDPGCNGEIIPIALPHYSGQIVWYDSRCTRCGTEYTDRDNLAPTATPSAPAAVPAYTPGGSR